MIPWYLKVAAVAAILAGAWLAYNHWRDGIWQQGYDARTAEYDKAAAAATIVRQAEVRAIEIAHAAALADVAETYERRLTNARTNADRTIADLRSGSIRLRDEWAGCETAALVSGAAGAAGLADDSARLRQQGAADIVRIGEECDARIEALQGAIRIRMNPVP